MTTSTNSSANVQPRDAAYWAQPASILKVGRTPTGALNLNVEGRQTMSPLQGFGQLWQKTFRVRLNGASAKPTEVIKTWKEHFPRFWLTRIPGGKERFCENDEKQHQTPVISAINTAPPRPHRAAHGS